jgi:ACS family glucarate transporter-like MFS transporter
VRYGVLAGLCSLAFVLYLDRVCISKAAGAMEHDLHLSPTRMGVVFGAFTLAYGLFEVPTGHWGDRHGSRGVLLRIVLWWSAFTALTGCVWPFRLDSGYRLLLPGLGVEVPLVCDSCLLLVLVRFGFGAGEAGALPNAARVLARWFPASARGPAQGLINTAMLVGGAVAPVAAAYLILAVGWRGPFLLFGLLEVAWAALFARWYRDDPAQHPAVNEAERRLVGAGGLGLAGLLLLASLGCRSPVTAALVTALACLSAGATVASWWAVVTEISGRHVGALFGLMNSLGVPGALASPLLFGAFADWRQAQGYTGREQWDPVFCLYGSVLVLGAAAWLFVDATRSAVEP